MEYIKIETPKVEKGYGLSILTKDKEKVNLFNKYCRYFLMTADLGTFHQSNTLDHNTDGPYFSFFECCLVDDADHFKQGLIIDAGEKIASFLDLHVEI